jgi:TLC domain
MINYLFILSTLSIFVYMYTGLISAKTNYLLLPYISSIISLCSTGLHKDDTNLHRFSKEMFNISTFWTAIWIMNIPNSSFIFAFLITNYLFYYINNTFQQFNLPNLTAQVIYVYININTSLYTLQEPANDFFYAGLTITMLATCNAVIKYTLNELDVSDRYISQCSENITCVVFQTYFCFNLSLEDSESKTEQAVVTLFSYFIYDTACILYNGRVAKQVVYIVHHIISLYILLLVFFSYKYDTSFHKYITPSLFILEIVNPFLNTMKTLKILHPESISYKVSLFISRIIYVVTRMAVLPLLIFYICTDKSLTLNPYILNQIIGGFGIIFLASANWCNYLLSSRF